MAKPLKVIGTIAGVVALVAGTIATAGIGAPAFAAAASTAGIGAPAFAAAASTVATVASLTSAAANIGASLLQKPPRARGSVTDVILAHDAPQPYVMGEGYVGAVIRHDAAWGATLKKVPNPYRAMTAVYSGGGPVQSISPRYDRVAVSSWYSGFLWTDTQLGATPESDALSPQWGGMPGWGSSAKLSGQAAIMWSFLFDKDGKRFANGIAELGAYGQWVKVYDPRLDSTFPGGSGSCRLGDETTYVWSESPALHAGTYAYGRYQNSKRVFGAGLRAIDWANIAAWANVCDANEWTIFGRIFEPGNRWENLKEIAAAGGAQPVVSSNGNLAFRYSAPTIMLDTIGPEDLADDPVKVTTMATWAERVNTIIPKCISPDHEWKLVAMGPVSDAGYVSDDGEIKTAEWPFNLVKDAGQAAQLAAYRLVDGRELNPIVITCNHRMRHYRAGDGLRIELPDYDISTDAIILQRQFDPVEMKVHLTLISETPEKHDFALGRTPDAPPAAALRQTPQERDELANAALAPARAAHSIVSYDPPEWPLSSDDNSITVAAFTGVLDDGRIVEFPGEILSGLTSSIKYGVFYDPITEEYSVAPDPATAERADDAYAFVGWQATSDSGIFPTPPPPPPGYGGGGGFYQNPYELPP